MAYTFVTPGQTDEILTYAELWRRASNAARAIQEHGNPDDRLVLLLPGGSHFVVGFLACMLARRAAVPSPPPRNERALNRTKGIVDDSGASAMLVMPGQRLRLEQSGLKQDGLHIIELSPELWDATESSDFPVLTTPDNIALLQYTSGSTSQPKGVVVRHSNLYDNLEHLRVRFGYGPESRLVSWLPIYHDMGLMGGMLAPFFAGVPGAIMLPQDFVMKPIRWLQLMSTFGGTVSGGPNFAYDICVSRISDEDVQSLDLSVWQAALNGAEPIRASTLERFSAKFAPAGFDPRAFLSCYGLAESTLLVSCTGLNDAPAVAAVDHKRLSEGVAEHSNSPGARRIVSCGKTIDNHELAILDTESGLPLAEHFVGEIVVSGPSVCLNYWDPKFERRTTDDALTQGTNSAPVLRTGDLGFQSNGELYVTGRRKNTVIIRGRNLSCEGVEEVVQSSHPSLYSCVSAALSVDDGKQEKLVVLQEVPPESLTRLEEIIGNIQEAVAAHHGVRVDDVVLVKTRSLPRTTSGKVRRTEALKRYRNGQLAPL
jgi:acyl-CoA synthetase (AMP-forming)/AMP-acid ligase II